jgi:predicted CXXCH cytochrome family protein
MRTGWLGILAVLSTLIPAAALGVDAPHDGSAANGTCEACHKIHNATGTGTLVNQPDNNLVCTVCHNDPTATINPGRLGLPWITEDQAVPGKGGAQHRWDALAASPAFGAALPSDPEMLKRIKDGRIQCAACHDPHADAKAFDPAALHTSMAPGTATNPTGGGTNTLTMTLTAPAAAATTKGYRVQVEGIAGAQFRLAISHNAKTTDGAPVWWVHNGAWVQGALGTGTTLRSTGTAIALDDGTNVQVTFTGTPAIGQFWDFYVSYAHLRASNVADAMCLQCHASRNQNHTRVEGPNLTGDVYSHPVGVTLNVNGKGYDRANVLDANGALQTVGDGNTTNDLTLVGGTTVSCTTCHNVHNADSNSLTTDAR